MSKTLQDHHNDGQTDASNGVNNPPHSGPAWLATQLFFSGSDFVKEMQAENESYQTGQDNVPK